MNKAFIKEDDGESGRCPRCDSPGIPVSDETLSAQLPEDVRGQIAVTAYFCGFARCPVVYFDGFERTIEQDVVPRAVYPKDPSAPLCHCFGLTEDDIRADLEDGAPTRTKRAIELARSPAARCATLSPSGRSCIADIQRRYLQGRGVSQP